MDSVHIEQAAGTQLFQVLYKASLENLIAGDILRGKVQSLDQGLLLIKLLDGASFTAEVPRDFPASQGDWITLEISERQNDRLMAKIISSEHGPADVRASEAVPVEAFIGQKLDSYGIRSSEKLISEVLELLKAEPGLSPEQASFITANGLESNQELFGVIQKLSEHEFQMTDNLLAVREGLINGLEKMDAAGRRELLKPLLMQLTVSQKADEIFRQIRQTLPQISEKLSGRLRESIRQNVHELLNKILLEETPDGDAIKNLLNNIPEQSILKPEEIKNILQIIDKAIEEMHTKADSNSSGDAGNAADVGKDTDVGKAAEAAKVVNKLFERLVIKAEKGSAEEFDMGEKAKALREALSFSAKVLDRMDDTTREQVLPALKEAGNALRFFEQATVYNTFMQMPLKINGENTTGELYVMGRKNKRKKPDAGNFTIFISLRTSGLGLVESLINAADKCVTINFGVEHQTLVNLIRENHRVLYDGLLKKGYRLADLRCRVIDGRTGLLNASEKAEEILGLHSGVDVKI